MPPIYHEIPYVMNDHELNIKPSDYELALTIKGSHRYFWFKSKECGEWGLDPLAIAATKTAVTYPPILAPASSWPPSFWRR